MKTRARKSALLLALAALQGAPALAEDKGAAPAACAVGDRACILTELDATAGKIENASWRDQVYRELAKTLAFEGRTDEAIALVDKIETPDTKAMTIRGIGMAVADNGSPSSSHGAVFQRLRESAEKITHPPSYAIALTYIAMGQAFAGDNEGAWKTASEMENTALRNKAYGETAEIQAEKGDFRASMKSIGLIDSPAYRNKSYNVVVKILAEGKMLAEALEMAQAISDPYKRAESLQYVLDKQKPRETPHMLPEVNGTKP